MDSAREAWAFLSTIDVSCNERAKTSGEEQAWFMSEIFEIFNSATELPKLFTEVLRLVGDDNAQKVATVLKAKAEVIAETDNASKASVA